MFNIGSRTILKKVKKDFYILEISPIKQLKIVNIILFKIKNPSNRAIIHAGILWATILLYFLCFIDNNTSKSCLNINMFIHFPLKCRKKIE